MLIFCYKEFRMYEATGHRLANEVKKTVPFLLFFLAPA